MIADQAIIGSIRPANMPSDLFYQLCMRTDTDIEQIQRIARHFQWPNVRLPTPPPSGFQSAGHWGATINGNSFTIGIMHGFNRDAGHNRMERFCTYSDMDSTEPLFADNLRVKSGLKKVPTSKPIEFLSDTGQEIGNLTIVVIRPPPSVTLGIIKLRIVMAIKAVGR